MEERLALLQRRRKGSVSVLGVRDWIGIYIIGRRQESSGEVYKTQEISWLKEQAFNLKRAPIVVRDL